MRGGVTPEPEPEPEPDLSGTTWYFNSELTETVTDKFNIDFVSNSYIFQAIQMAYARSHYRLNYFDALSNKTPYVDSWLSENEEYRTINITGGADATNTTLIAWLQENATQVS